MTLTLTPCPHLLVPGFDGAIIRARKEVTVFGYKNHAHLIRMAFVGLAGVRLFSLT